MSELNRTHVHTSWTCYGFRWWPPWLRYPKYANFYLFQLRKIFTYILHDTILNLKKNINNIENCIIPDGPEPGSVKFDPLKFSENSPEWVPWFREAELKHGRIAMLATAGWIAVDLGVRLPNHDYNSLQAHTEAVQSGALLQVLLWVSLLEHISIPACKALFDGSREPGYFSFDPLGLGKKDMKKLQVNELKNGRLAMLAFGGIATQAALGHASFPYL